MIIPVDIQKNTKVVLDHVLLCGGSGSMSSFRYAVVLEPVDSEKPRACIVVLVEERSERVNMFRSIIHGLDGSP